MAVLIFGGLVLIIVSGKSQSSSLAISTEPTLVETESTNTLFEQNTIISQSFSAGSDPTTSGSTQSNNTSQKLDIPPESLLIVDSQHPLTEEFLKTMIEPKLITIIDRYPEIPVINSGTQILAVCGDDLNAMLETARSEGIDITVRSAFRSYYQQQVAYDQATDKTSVNLPGESQHHTGLAIDFTSPEIGNIVGIYSGFSQSQAGLWLAAHAYQFGFVLTYTNNHDGIRNEDWHYFYVGRDLAQIWHDRRAAGENIDLFALQEQYSNPR